MATDFLKTYDSTFQIQRTIITVIQCYAPTNNAAEEKKAEFYNIEQNTINKAPTRDIKILMRDMNATIGSNNNGKEHIMGTQDLGDIKVVYLNTRIYIR